MSEKDISSLMPIERIQSALPTLSKTHRIIAEYILKNYETTAFMTSVVLSQKCGVSESSVIRFAMTLGYSGFTELQKSLQGVIRSHLSMQKRLELVNAQMAESDSIIDVVMKKNIEGIQRTFIKLDRDAFQKVVHLLATAKRVFLFGSRSSSYLVNFMGLELCWIRENVFTLNVQSPEFDSLSRLKEGDVFFAISMPRYLKAVTHAAQVASEAGIPVIAVTDSVTSPLYKYASVPLLVDNEMFSYSDNIIPIVSVITAILNAVGLELQPQSNEALALNEQNWDKLDLYF